MNKKLLLAIPYSVSRREVPHLGIAVISGAAKQAGATVEIGDYRREIFEPDNLPTKYDIIGFSISNEDTFKWVKQKCKEIKKGTLLIAGGPLPTMIPEKLLKRSPLEVCVIGQGQNQIKEILQGKPLNQVRGIAYKKGKKIMKTQPADRFQEHIIDNDYIENHFSKTLEEAGKKVIKPKKDVSVPIMAGKGCYGSCTYCLSPILNKKTHGKKYWYREAKHIIEEIKMWEERGYKKFFLLGDNIVSKKNFLSEFVEELEKNEIEVNRLGMELRAEGIIKHKKELERLAKISKLYCEIGFESGSQRLLDLIKKGTTVKQNKQACEILLGLEAEIHPFLIMFTHPEARLEDIKENLKFYEWLGKKGIQIDPHSYENYLVGIPSTEFFNYLIDKKGYEPDSFYIQEYEFDDPRVQELKENIEKPFSIFAQLSSFSDAETSNQTGHWHDPIQEKQVRIFDIFLQAAQGEKKLRIAKMQAKKIQKKLTLELQENTEKPRDKERLRRIIENLKQRW